MPDPLPKDATFLHLGWSPAKVIRFLSRVQAGMVKLARPNREVVVRMAVAGTGTVPDYRFELDGGERLLTICGAKHKPLPQEGAPEDERSWSTSTMSFYEVTDALMELASAELDKLASASRTRT